MSAKTLYQKLDSCITHSVPSPATLSKVISEMLILQTDPTLPSTLVDCIFLINLEHALHPSLLLILSVLKSTQTLPESLCLQRLDAEILQAIGLIPDSKAFERRIVKTNTTLKYTHVKYNLLREQSEGYCKLHVELISNLVQPLDSFWTQDRERSRGDLINIRDQEIQQNTKFLNSNIVSLIGYYDLDPHRVLDIILDAFAANVLDHWDFFLILLRLSNWSRISTVLGFKLQNTTLPSLQVYYVVALCVKHKLVDIDIIYPFLSPGEEGMDLEYEDWLKRMKLEAGKSGRFNGGEREKAPACTNQKANLIQCLLAVGDVTSACLMMRRDMRVVEVYPEIGFNMCRLMQVMVEGLDPEPKAVELDESESVECPLIGTLNTRQCVIDTAQSAKKSKPLIFFYKGWKDGVDVCNTYDAVIAVMKEYVKFVGPYMNEDTLLASKLIRVAIAHIESGADCKSYWLQVVRETFLPTLMSTIDNASLSSLLWTLLKYYPIQTRYELYLSIPTTPVLNIYLKGSRRDVQYVMNRLSKENVKMYGGILGKMSHGCAGVVFTYMVNSVQGYDNMIPFVVEATEYVTKLGLDVLMCCIVSALGGSFGGSGAVKKSKIESNGTTIEKWVKSLAVLVGSIFKKYDIDMEGLIVLIMEELKEGRVYDLVVLEELMSAMSGVNVTLDTTWKQLELMSGGVLLNNYQTKDVDKVKETKQRLFNGLQGPDKGVEIGRIDVIGVLIAKAKLDVIRRVKVEESEDIQLKVLAWTSDLCQRVFLQYYSFLTSLAPSPDSDLPSTAPVTALTALELNDFGLDKCQSYHITRPELPLRLGMNLEEYFYELDLCHLMVPEERYLSLLASLEDGTLLKEELEGRKSTSLLALSNLKVDSLHWFNDSSIATEKRFLLDHLNARLTFSSKDSLYCSLFIKHLDTLNIPNFNMKTLIRTLFGKEVLFGTVFAVTEGEAVNYGSFLADILTYLSPSSMIVNTAAGILLDESMDGIKEGTEETREAIQSNLNWLFHTTISSKEYMQLRNSLIVLDKIIDHFPRDFERGSKLMMVVKELEEEPRSDLKQMGRSLFAKLKVREATWTTAIEVVNVVSPVVLDQITAEKVEVEKIAVEMEEQEEKEEGEVVRKEGEVVRKENEEVKSNILKALADISRGTPIKKGHERPFGGVEKSKEEKDRRLIALLASERSQVSTRGSPRDSPRSVPLNIQRETIKDSNRDTQREPHRDNQREPQREPQSNINRDNLNTRENARESPRDSPRDSTRDGPRDGPRENRDRAKRDDRLRIDRSGGRDIGRSLSDIRAERQEIGRSNSDSRLAVNRGTGRGSERNSGRISDREWDRERDIRRQREKRVGDSKDDDNEKKRFKIIR